MSFTDDANSLTLICHAKGDGVFGFNQMDSGPVCNNVPWLGFLTAAFPDRTDGSSPVIGSCVRISDLGDSIHWAEAPKDYPR
jgi:hypothetical protein